MKKMALGLVCLLFAMGVTSACEQKESGAKPQAAAHAQAASPEASPAAYEANDDVWVRIRFENGEETIIEDREDAKAIAETMTNAPFANAMVSMSRPPDYTVDVGTENGNYGYAIEGIYQVWISPPKDRLEVVQDSGRYVQLTPEASEAAIRILKAL